jgi:hypothetical protein
MSLMIPVLAGIGALCMSNPRRRRRKNPGILRKRVAKGRAKWLAQHLMLSPAGYDPRTFAELRRDVLHVIRSGKRQRLSGGGGFGPITYDTITAADVTDTLLRQVEREMNAFVSVEYSPKSIGGTLKMNPRGGTAPDGWHYNLKDNREWREFQVIARTPAGKLHEGRKQFFPYDSYDRASKREARAEAEKMLALLIATGRDHPLPANPRRRNPGAEVTGSKAIGAKLQQWHSGSGDPIYAVGSHWYASRPVGRLVVEQAVANLRRLIPHYSGKDARQLRALASALARRLSRTNPRRRKSRR